MYGYYPNMGWWMVLSTIFWLALVAIAVWALVRFVVHQTHAASRHDAGDVPYGPSAEEILRQRFARGEIDAETFERMRAQLEQEAPRTPVRPGAER